MKKSNVSIAILVMALSLGFAGIDDVQAKRFGGARSFGGKPFYSTPYRRSALPSRAAPRSARQQQAYQKNQTLRQNMSRRGGLWGMLGALAIGGLLGSLLFGGAFQGLNLMDMLMFAGITYLLYRLFAARKPQPAYQRNTLDGADGFSKSQSSFPAEESATSTSSPFNTDVLFGNKPVAQNLQDTDFDAPLSLPAGFDEQDFLKGAKNAFQALQKAWDNRDLAEIRSLTTDKVFAEIQDQLNEMTEPNQTEVLKLEAELLDVRELDDELEAVVLFDSIMRENSDEAAVQVREVWHFIKPKRAIQPKWYLDGIQQLED